MTEDSPKCLGCDREMHEADDPWLIALTPTESEAAPEGTEGGHQVELTFFCPDCECRVETFAMNRPAHIMELQQNSPAGVAAARSRYLHPPG